MLECMAARKLVTTSTTPPEVTTLTTVEGSGSYKTTTTEEIIKTKGKRLSLSDFKFDSSEMAVREVSDGFEVEKIGSGRHSTLVIVNTVIDNTGYDINEHKTIVDKIYANQFLSSPQNRAKRSNDGLFEEDQRPDYQRECVEEDCNYLEMYEIVIKEWPGRDELFKKMYNPAYIGDKTKTNINIPVHSLNDNRDEFLKQAIKDLENIVYNSCEYYHTF